MPHLVLPSLVKIHYKLWGAPGASAPKLLLLCPSHTSMADLQTYVVGPTAAVKCFDQFSCLSLDYRGMGESSMPSDGEPWPAPTVSVYADDVRALLAYVGWTSCNVAGFSFGGAVAQELLLTPATALRASIMKPWS